MSETKVDEVVEEIKARIEANRYGEEGRLPSLRELAEQMETSRETINKAVQLLQSEGWLYSRGRSIYVQLQRKRLPTSITLRFDLALKEQGLIPVETDLEPPALVPASHSVANILSIPEGTKVVRRYRRQGSTSAHYRLVETFYSSALAGGEILRQMQEDQTFDVLMAIRDTDGTFILPVQEETIARLPIFQEQKLLDIKRTTPVFEMQRICTDRKGEVIMLNHIIFVASYFFIPTKYETTHWLPENQKS